VTVGSDRNGQGAPRQDTLRPTLAMLRCVARCPEWSAGNVIYADLHRVPEIDRSSKGVRSLQTKGVSMLGKQSVLVIAGLLATIAVVAGIALAAIPASGVITGCYKKSGSELRIIDGTVTNCKSPETKLEWNVQGVKGDPGTRGTNGTNGSNGTNGKDGVSGWERIVSAKVPVAAGAVGSQTADCPSGKKAVGGGWLAFGTFLPVISVSTSQPDDEGRNWFVQIRNRDTQATDLVVYAVCVIAS